MRVWIIVAVSLLLLTGFARAQSVRHGNLRMQPREWEEEKQEKEAKAERAAKEADKDAPAEGEARDGTVRKDVYVPHVRQRQKNEERSINVRIRESRQQQAAEEKAHPTRYRSGVRMVNEERLDPKLADARLWLRRKDDYDLGARTTQLPEKRETIKVGETSYVYGDGTFFRRAGRSYTIVAPPVGAILKTRPKSSRTVRAKKEVYYYRGGFFFAQRKTGGYQVVRAPMGAVVPYLPQSFDIVTVKGGKYYRFANVLYSPVMVNGEVAYKVVAN